MYIFMTYYAPVEIAYILSINKQLDLISHCHNDTCIMASVISREIEYWYYYSTCYWS